MAETPMRAGAFIRIEQSIVGAAERVVVLREPDTEPRPIARWTPRTGVSREDFRWLVSSAAAFHGVPFEDCDETVSDVIRREREERELDVVVDDDDQSEPIIGQSFDVRDFLRRVAEAALDHGDYGTASRAAETLLTYPQRGGF